MDRKTIALIVTGILLIIAGVVLMAVATAHPAAPQRPTVESKVIYSVPVEWHGMECVEQSDTNGNIWINDCNTNGS